ncbi:hypothetical protein KIAC18_003954 [Sporomusa sphaeroides]|uniref:hypothetical protein n=1 Tax=Sporomusa sphaeroides TaxID=47679 RepID=UPI003DA005CA
MAAMIQFMVSGRQYEFEKNKAGQGIRNLVLNIKKAAPSKEADTKISQRNYITVQTQPARLFDKYKKRLEKMLDGYRCAVDTFHDWDKLPDGEILRLARQYQQHAKKCHNAFYLGVALYALQVLRRRVAA